MFFDISFGATHSRIPTPAKLIATKLVNFSWYLRGFQQRISFSVNRGVTTNSRRRVHRSSEVDPVQGLKSVDDYEPVGSLELLSVPCVPVE